MLFPKLLSIFFFYFFPDYLKWPTKMDDDDSNSKMGEKYKWEMDPYLAAVVNISGKY